MKNLANCTPDEFMAQVVKFRAPFEAWMKKIGAQEIRARRPEGYDDLNAQEKADIDVNIGIANLGAIALSALEKDAEATKSLLCLATFTDRKDFNNHSMTEDYIPAVMEMITNRAVRNFFGFILAQMPVISSKD